jgi:tetratricopeptide (TPR) repeat protein
VWFRAAHRQQPRVPLHLVEIAREERALGRLDAAEATLRAALALEPAHVQGVMQLGELMLAGERAEECAALGRAALERHPTESWLHHLLARAVAACDGAAAALAGLDEAIGRLGDRPELLALRLGLLREAGDRERLQAMLPACEALAPISVHIREQVFEFCLASGDFSKLRAGLDARVPTDGQEAARIEGIRGDLAIAEWRIADAVGHYREAARQNPGCAHTAHKLAFALMMDVEFDAATEALKKYLERQGAVRRRFGLSNNPSQTQLGQMLNEFRLDRPVIAALRRLRELPAAERIAPLREVVRENPDHTLAAMMLLLALRQAGCLVVPQAAGEARIPRRIAQYWMQGEAPEDLSGLMQTWRRHHPDHDWHLFDHASACAFLRARAPEVVLRAYLRAGQPAQRADLFRLAWLHAEGGVWVDADDRCHRKLASIVPAGVTFAAHQEEFASIGNNVLACVPGHPVIGRALAAASEAVDRGDADLLWLSTGPGLLTRAVAGHLAEAPADAVQDMAILERWQLAAAVDIHCGAAYKRAAHWSRAQVGFQRRGADAAVPA